LEQLNEHWWNIQDHETLASELSQIVTKLDEDQAYRQDLNLRNLRLYSSLAIMGLGANEYTGQESLPSNRLKLNVVESVCETIKAVVATDTTKVRFLTDGGTRKDRQKAENLTRFVSGQFHAAKARRKGAAAIADGIIFGTGALKIFEEDGDVAVERVFPDEIIIDDVEGKYGEPRSLYQTKSVEKSVLKKMYPKLAAQIEGAEHIRDDVPVSQGFADPVTVVMAWHLPSAKGAGDGRYVEGVSTCVFHEEEWKEPDFPFVFFRWVDRSLGFWGKGVPEQLRGVQIEINMLLQKIQRMLNLASSKVFVAKGSHINTKALDNTEWGVVEYAGDKPPVFATVQAVAPEYYNQLWQLYQRAFEIVGVSQLVAGGVKPPGIDSGRGLREFDEIQTKRYMFAGKMVQEFYLDLADQMIRLAKRIKGYSVLADDGERAFRIDWKDVDPGGADKFRMIAWPASLLPDTPAGQLQTITELLNIEPRLQGDALRWLKQPDVTAALKRVNAPAEVVEKVISAILDEDRYIAPRPYMDLQEGITRMQYATLEAITDEVDEKKIALMEKWMEQAHELLTAGMQATQPPVPMPGMAPEGNNMDTMGPEMQLPGTQPGLPVGATPTQ
jgi:hypothetical protein